MTAAERGYRPIGDYALIGDAHTAALVAADGAIDWCCWPHFASPAVFCRLLDAGRGGFFRVGPAGPADVARAYAGDTNVLATTFTTAGGSVRLTDFMPVEPRSDGRGEDIGATHNILRLVEGLSGEVDVAVEFRPAFDYARAPAAIEPAPGGAVARAGHTSLSLACPVKLRPDSEGAAGAVRVTAGDRLWFSLVYRVAGTPAPPAFSAVAGEAALERTLAYWRTWSARCTYTGPYHPLVRRSALALKLLTFEPTGAIIAAPTTSLPEEVGGARNWDYRFTWLRDAGLTLNALQAIGYHAEAEDFFQWLSSLCTHGRGDLQIMYRIDGGAELPEQTLDHLDGYRGSRPVRIGNAAAGQIQLDVYGEVLDAAYIHAVAMRGRPGENLRAMLSGLAERAAARWREPDQGIWEVRGGPRHFLYSKLLCWVALDRAVRLAERGTISGDVARWRRTREAIRRAILAEGYDEGIGAFTQALGDGTLDASALAIPLVGFLPATDPRVISTVERVRERLTAHGLVYRYVGEDGLPGGEATFALCSFWLVDNLALAGRTDEARALFERIAGYANDVGLLAEEIDPASGALLGNFPQGFTHLALIRSALTIAAAETSGAEAPGMAHPDGAWDVGYGVVPPGAAP